MFPLSRGRMCARALNIWIKPLYGVQVDDVWNDNILSFLGLVSRRLEIVLVRLCRLFNINEYPLTLISFGETPLLRCPLYSNCQLEYPWVPVSIPFQLGW